MGVPTNQRLSHRLFAEGAGTFLLVLFGTGSIVVAQVFPGTITHLGICLVFGGIVSILVMMYGEVSGAHLNPAVTLALVAGSKVRIQDVWAYLPAQFIGAILASAVIGLAYPGLGSYGNTYLQVGPATGWVVEFLMTAILLLVVLEYPAVPGLAPFKPVAVGGIIFLEAMVAGPLTGASMNPARSLGPAIVSGDFRLLWLYLTAPVAGATLAAMLHRGVRIAR